MTVYIKDDVLPALKRQGYKRVKKNAPKRLPDLEPKRKPARRKKFK